MDKDANLRSVEKYILYFILTRFAKAVIFAKIAITLPK